MYRQATLLDHFIGASKEGSGNVQSYCFRGFQVDHQAEAHNC
jgi:hypothetical protein